MKYEGEMGRIQRALAQCHDAVVRQTAVLDSLNLRTGERSLEFGCGAGFYAYEAAQFVGPTGQVRAVDISEDQIAVARERCADLPWVECRVADVLDLPYEDAVFDVIYGVQVLEYVANVDGALQELRRVLRPGGRLVILATNWSSVVLYSTHPERMKKVLSAWDKHAPYPDLPAELPSRLNKIGMKLVRQKALPILNTSYNESSLSYWSAKLIKPFVVGSELVDAPDVDAWFDEFEKLESEGAYFYCSAPIITEAIRVS